MAKNLTPKANSYTLFLDDEREPVDPKSRVCRSFEEAVACVETYGVPTHVDFDHDLGEDKTGYDFARWLTDYDLDVGGFPETYAVHSQNPIGRRAIVFMMEGYKIEKEKGRSSG